MIAFASSDNLGTDAALEFETTSKSLGIDVVKSLSFPPGETDFAGVLNEAQPYDARIFVFLITNVADASALLVQGFDSGVFNTLTMFFFTTSLQVKLMLNIVESWKSTYLLESASYLYLEPN